MPPKKRAAVASVKPEKPDDDVAPKGPKKTRTAAKKKAEAKNNEAEGEVVEVPLRKTRAAKNKPEPEPEKSAPEQTKPNKRGKKQAEEQPSASNSNGVKETSSKKKNEKAQSTKAEKKEKEPKAGPSTEKKGKNAPEKGEKGDVPVKISSRTSTKWDEISFQCAKKSPSGQSFNLHIISWNVDGIRAWIKKDGLKIVDSANPDIFCVQETRCSEQKLPEELDFEGYKAFWCSSKKEGYAGVGIFTKLLPVEVSYGIGSEEHDKDGRCITAEFEKFYLINVYVPNAGRKLVTLPNRLKWNEKFKEFVSVLDKKKQVIICGDMNVAHSEIDLANPKTNKRNAGFTVEEREGLTDFLQDGYVDVFRKLYPDQIGAYTFWAFFNNARAKNVGWRLDYFIISERLAKDVCDTTIHNQVFGSDHCPVSLFLNV